MSAAPYYILIFPKRHLTEVYEAVINSRCATLHQAECFAADRKANGEAFAGEVILECGGEFK